MEIFATEPFYVQISRAVHGLTLVTDDAEKLVRAIRRNNDEKSAAIEMVSSQQLKQHDLRFNHQSKVNIQKLIDDKISNDQCSSSKINTNNLSKNNADFDKKISLKKDISREKYIEKNEVKIKEIEI